MTIKNTKKILIAPLDWGLGHTTRCVPIIQHILDLGHEVFFAGNQQQRDYITATFPDIATIRLEGYNVSYSKSALTFMSTIAKQIPSILQAIKNENRWLKKIVLEHEIDGIISDNRYGLHHPTIPCVIMTHQLQILTGVGKVADNIMRRLHRHSLKKFNYCWVVDVANKPGLAGKLSHLEKMPDNTKYIGLLSQLKQMTSPESDCLLILLSGPEPQRTILSNILWQQVLDYSGSIVFVEGSESIQGRSNIPSHIIYHKRLVNEKLHEAISNADLVISRSGYSTIMDLVKMNKKAILIPTPGQTEQEYLGKTLQELKLFTCMQQEHFDLLTAIGFSKSQLNKTHFIKDFKLYTQALDNWLNSIQLS